jgi:hypothetical protein
MILPKMDYYMLFYIASGTLATTQIAHYLYSHYNARQTQSSQSLALKSIIEKKQS